MTKLQELSEGFGRNSISAILSKYLEDYGLNKNLIDIALCDGGIYAILSDGTLRRAVIHKNIVDIKEYKKTGTPTFHVCGCEELKELELKGQLQDYKVSIKHDNGFNFIVRDGNEELKVFHDAKLPLCPKCEQKIGGQFEFQSFFSKVLIDDTEKRKKDLEILSIVYKRMKHFFCESCNARVDTKDIENLKLKIIKKEGKIRLKTLCKTCDSNP